MKPTLLSAFFLFLYASFSSVLAQDNPASGYENHEKISNEVRMKLVKLGQERGSADFYVVPNIRHRALCRASRKLSVPKSEILLFVDAELIGIGKNCLIIATD